MTLKDFMEGLRNERENLEILKKHCSFNIEKYVNNPNVLDVISAEKYNEIRSELISMGFTTIEEKTSPKVVYQSGKIIVDSDPSYYYDYDLKMRYLESTDYNEDTKRVVRSYFRKVSEMEESLDKDIHNFKESECAELLKSVNFTTMRSLYNLVNAMSRYVDYALQNNLRTVSKENPFVKFSNQDILEKFVAEDKLHWSKKEVMRIAMECVNAQDGAIIALLFDGLSHKNNFAEFSNLRVKDLRDIDDNIVYVEGRKDPIKISTETRILLVNAVKDSKYYSLNTSPSREYDIVKTDYVFRGVRDNGEEKVSFRILNQRILRIAKEFDYEKFNATNISLSGQVHMAIELYNADKEIKDRAISYTLKNFNLPENRSSFFTLKKRVQKYTGVNIPPM